ncbi:hypothetical protein BDP55DRAFT_277304 [Colletotrichum godetiae]|uniref:Uncharacterized protein n=1 Tax=Colletotrichum godetiae TaxID=1209918 RepID=A0AAJ0AF16_9PEZI|nr:uncharacterized protein BDP55DRAFT_277304 [Colletotrichum godetiae]KAK1672044.1 hypothetical protein BDP55DRAFT_277304 [Colletotrichum godetiae]
MDSPCQRLSPFSFPSLKHKRTKKNTTPKRQAGPKNKVRVHCISHPDSCCFVQKTSLYFHSKKCIQDKKCKKDKLVGALVVAGRLSGAGGGAVGRVGGNGDGGGKGDNVLVGGAVILLIVLAVSTDTAGSGGGLSRGGLAGAGGGSGSGSRATDGNVDGREVRGGEGGAASRAVGDGRGARGDGSNLGDLDGEGGVAGGSGRVVAAPVEVAGLVGGSAGERGHEANGGDAGLHFDRCGWVCFQRLLRLLVRIGDRKRGERSISRGMFLKVLAARHSLRK